MGTPYTYLLGWSNQEKYYYGVRFAENCDPSDLWNKYFTSSSHVCNFRKKFGDPDIIQVRKIFKTSEAARNWESQVLQRMNVINDNRFLNKSTNKAIDPKACAYYHTDEIRKKKSLSHIGLKHTEETKRKIGKAHKGRKTPWLTGLSRPEHSKLMQGTGNPNAKRVIYNGKEYGTCKEMTNDTGISIYKINKMIESNKVQVLTGVK